MSLNSLQNSMSHKAASMAAMAKRANNPQDIQAMQQRLITGVQNGTIQPYVGIPLIQDLTKKLTEVKAQMAQAVTGAGMPPPPQGGAPIAQQVMQQAAQESQGVEALPSNLPQSYAGGGIIAFEDGGQVEHYANDGLVPATPAGRFFSGIGQNFNEANEAAKLRSQLQMKYGPASALPGLFMNQTDAERQTAKDIAGRLDTLTLPQLKALYEQGPSALPPITPVTTSTPVTTPAVVTPTPLASASNAPPATPPPAAPAIPGSNFKMPTLPTMKETAAPTLTDYSTIIGNMPEKTKAAFDTARTAEEKYLRDLTEPGEKAREEKFGKREAGLEKDVAINRAFSLISTGLGIAGSKERTLAGALGNEGRQGIADLIRGEAANRVAKERLEDARDNFEQQKIASKKGDRSAATAAGQRASDDLRAGTQLTMTGAHYGNTEALNRYQTQQQGEFQKASLGQAGILGLSELGLKRDQLNQTGAFQNRQLAAQEKRFAALDKASQARLDQVRVNAFNGFNKDVAPTINAQLVKQYGPNWQTAKDPRSLEAQMVFKQYRDAHIMDALGKHDERMSYGRSADELLQSGQ